MSAEIIKPFGLHGTPGIDPEVVALLEQTLAEAKAGEVSGFAMVIMRPNGVVGTLVRKGTASTCECAGAVSISQHDVLTSWKG